MTSSRAGSSTESKELAWDASGPRSVCTSQRRSDTWKPSLFCFSGWGGSALQEVPEKLKATCGQLLVGSCAKNNLGREQRMVRATLAHAAKPMRAPGLPCLRHLSKDGQGTTLPCTSAPHSSQRASSSADATHCPSYPSWPESWAQTPGSSLSPLILSSCLPPDSSASIPPAPFC